MKKYNLLKNINIYSKKNNTVINLSNMKLISFILIIISIIVTGCEKSSIEAVVIDSEGNSSKMKASEIVQLKENNAAMYDKKYYKAKVTVVSKVKKITGPFRYIDHNEYYNAYLVKLYDNWEVRIGENHKILKDLKIGNKVKVSEAKIANIFSGNVTLVGAQETPIHEKGRIVNYYLEYPDETNIKIID